MGLKSLDLKDRSFLIQFGDIVSEFGHEIPRLKKIINLKYVTDKNVFEKEIFNLLGLESTEKIKPYILTTDDKREEYIWWILYFSKSPEKFEDPNNELIRKQLESEKYAYITCLQIRDNLRQNNYGTQILSKSGKDILEEFHNVRWVFSKQQLIQYYKYFGMEIVNNAQNKDGLFIWTFNEKTFRKRY